MRLHKEDKRQERWSERDYLKRFINLIRFDQIHRYFLLRDEDTNPRKDGESFTWKIESINSMIQ